MDDPRLLEEVLLDLRALDDALLVEDDVDVLAEAGGVVVADGLGVAEGLQDGVGLQDLDGNSIDYLRVNFWLENSLEYIMD